MHLQSNSKTEYVELMFKSRFKWDEMQILIELTSSVSLPASLPRCQSVLFFTLNSFFAVGYVGGVRVHVCVCVCV